MALQEDGLHDLFRKSVAAVGASVLSVLVTTPLDVVKVRPLMFWGKALGRILPGFVWVKVAQGSFHYFQDASSVCMINE